jgi:hypothetical protein
MAIRPTSAVAPNNFLIIVNSLYLIAKSIFDRLIKPWAR